MKNSKKKQRERGRKKLAIDGRHDMGDAKDRTNPDNGVPDFERRPNPPGWVQPKAPYNPYDPTDLRPAEGYPSEYNAPTAVKKNTGHLARDLTDYQKIKIDMKKLQYYPRPPSELYPGRYKVLRRVNYKSGFTRGADLTAKVSIYSVLIFGVFFYRWNDHDNIFSPFRRAQLRVKELILGDLSVDDYNDLYNYKEDLPIPQKPLPSRMYEKNAENNLVGESATNNEFIKDRFGNKHVVYAEHIKQKEDENMVKALEIAQRQLELKQMGGSGDAGGQQQKKPFWKVW